MTSNTASISSAQSFRDWSEAGHLSDGLSRAEAAVRAEPQQAGARWLLFELLCVLGQWDRALKQLQTWAGLSKDSGSTAHAMRGLIRAEHQRMEVFAGRRLPATVTAHGAEGPAWLSEMGQALRLAAAAGEGALEASDCVRESALARAPATRGRSSLNPGFAWITDTDTRLGPVCEVVMLGAYRWLPFADIASVVKVAPASLLDLVWSRVDVVMRDGAGLQGYMPMRYPVQPGDRDALLLARETVWHDVGRTGVHAQGQKMWMTDAGDMALLDLRDCDFVTGLDRDAPAHPTGREDSDAAH